LIYKQDTTFPNLDCRS